jgi:hypothetical protein
VIHGGGMLALANVPCIEVANIDLTFDNIMMDNQGQYTVIDYEWVFDKIPLDFIIYRSITNFANRYQEYFNGKVSLDLVFTRIGLTPDQQFFYQQMEQHFQFYVYGQTGSCKINQNYRQSRMTLEQLQHKAVCIDHIVTDLEQAGYASSAHLQETSQNKKTQASTVQDGRVIQVFVSNDQRFIEEHSICVSVDSSVNHYEFDVSWLDTINQIRFDPLNVACIIKLQSLQAVDTNGKILDIMYGGTNADIVEENIYYFSTEDPQIYFSVNPSEHRMPIKKIVISFTYLEAGQQGILAILRQMTYLHQQLEKKDRHIEGLTNEVLQKEQQIADIINSRRYQLAGKMQKIYRSIVKQS